MSHKIEIPAGTEFGNWTCLGDYQNGCWKCRCVCGKTQSVRGADLRRGQSKGCGCQKTSRIKNLSGKQFNQLTVLSEYERKERSTKWKCKCSCGNIKYIRGYDLQSGATQSCGCLKQNQDPTLRQINLCEYNTWLHLKARCYDSNDSAYKYYGERGIRVCSRWLECFENFYEDMGSRPSNEHSIDRQDVDKEYSPENCRWATIHEQAINKRRGGKYVGVSIRQNKSGKMYYCGITKNHQVYNLGTFKTELEAATAYDNKCEELYGYRPNSTVE